MNMKLLSLFLIALASFGCAEGEVQRPPKPKKSSVATAGPVKVEKTSAAPESPKAPEPPIVEVTPAVKLTVQSEWLDEPAAVEDALNKAQVELMAKLQALDPPVLAKPTRDTIRRFYKKSIEREYPTKAQQVEFEKSGISPQRVRVSMLIELTENQVRQLRSGERVSVAARGAVLIAMVLGALYGFLRFDSWTKGYFTIWLGVAAVVAVIAAVMAMA